MPRGGLLNSYVICFALPVRDVEVVPFLAASAVLRLTGLKRVLVLVACATDSVVALPLAGNGSASSNDVSGRRVTSFSGFIGSHVQIELRPKTVGLVLLNWSTVLFGWQETVNRT